MYAIYLNTENEHNASSNNYGYWTGKSYTVQGESYPITVNFRDEISIQGLPIKVYKSKKVAENSASKALDKFGYAVSANVIALEDIPERPYKPKYRTLIHSSD